MDNWCTIESDPAVFTELIEEIGVQGVEVTEVFALDDAESIRAMAPIYGFVFLFKWTKKGETNRKRQLDLDTDMFFAKQVITNACATQAILSILLNSNGEIPLPESLANLQSFGSALDPYSRGLAIGQLEDVRRVHNSFSRPEPILYSQEKGGKKKEDVFHFVAYLRHAGKVYELDGLQEGPNLISEAGGENVWIESVLSEIRDRIQSFPLDEIKFNLLVLKKSTIAADRQQLAQAEAHLSAIDAELSRLGAPQNTSYSPPLSQGLAQVTLSETSLADLQAAKARNLELRSRLLWQVKVYEEQRAAQKLENERRKHNYLPLVFELLKMASESGDLENLYKTACLTRPN